MRYLLDVNALVAPGFLEHEFHERVALWVKSLAKEASYALLTCAITELGFVRVLSQAPHYGLTVAQSRALLVRLKRQREVPFEFIADDHDISRLPPLGKERAANHRRPFGGVGAGTQLRSCDPGRTDSFRVRHPGLV